MATYEYKFVRLGESRASAIFGVADKARKAEVYQDIVHEHARDGWRLVQIFAPGCGCVRRIAVLRAHLRAGEDRVSGWRGCV